MAGPNPAQRLPHALLEGSPVQFHRDRFEDVELPREVFRQRRGGAAWIAPPLDRLTRIPPLQGGAHRRFARTEVQQAQTSVFRCERQRIDRRVDDGDLDHGLM